MATATRSLWLCALLAAAPMVAREAAAQVVRVSATVVRNQTIALQADSVRTAAPEGVQRVRIDGVGLLDVLGGPGGVIRATIQPADRIVRVTIDYVGS